MKKFWIILSVLCAFIGFSAYAQTGSGQPVHQDLKKLRKDYQAQMSKDLKDINHRIKVLEHDARKAENKAKADMNAQVKKLKAQKKDVDKKFAELKKSTDEAWGDLRKGMDDAFADLKKSVDEASESYKK